DIVMDFTLKSPISVSVAHRINRQYIGISKNTKPTIQRLQSVIDGEQGGVSKSLKWQGGG
ncbi:MAG: site-specific DNA-methyltransferase, partial [Campylobacter sp.]|nr:site-specific DNA-methyltransferase [Campylobacter sp.]